LQCEIKFCLVETQSLFRPFLSGNINVSPKHL